MCTKHEPLTYSKGQHAGEPRAFMVKMDEVLAPNDDTGNGYFSSDREVRVHICKHCNALYVPNPAWI